MTIEQIRELHQARPFRPFRISLADGREIPITHPELLAVNPKRRTIYAVAPDGTGHYIDLLLVVSLDQVQRNGGRRRRRER